jgi:hypothetical protein
MSSCFAVFPAATIHAAIIKIKPTTRQLLLLGTRCRRHRWTAIVANGIHHERRNEYHGVLTVGNDLLIGRLSGGM